MRGGGRVPDRAARPEFLARRISGVAIFPCESGRDEVSEQALAATFDKGGAERVTRLYRCDDLR
jgi:protein-L-isoaspartate(D-aspartate) O-methyltransferase